jgi:hypothetical protein
MRRAGAAQGIGTQIGVSRSHPKFKIPKQPEQTKLSCPKPESFARAKAAKSGCFADVLDYFSLGVIHYSHFHNYAERR